VRHATHPDRLLRRWGFAAWRHRGPGTDGHDQRRHHRRHDPGPGHLGSPPMSNW